VRASVVGHHSRCTADRSLAGRNQAGRSPGADRSLGRRAAAHRERCSRHRDEPLGSMSSRTDSGCGCRIKHQPRPRATQSVAATLLRFANSIILSTHSGIDV
jgi:hypothetical protein